MPAEIRTENRTLIARLHGDWRVDRSIPRFGALIAERGGTDGLAEVRFDASELGEWDSSLPAFLLDGLSYCEARGISWRDEALPADVRRLLSLARVAPDREAARAAPRPSIAARVGSFGIGAGRAFLSFAAFLGELAVATVRVVTGRDRMRWRDLWLTIQGTGANALPIVTLISFLVGLIIAFLGSIVLSEFGADYYISYLIGFGMLRQMAALMTAIIMAGRTGAAFAAELGSMKLMEELDAYETLGLSPMSYLVLPRVLGVVLMMPVLTVYAMFVGILGGLVVAVTIAGLAVEQYFSGLFFPITVVDGLLGIFKAVVFGVIIGVTGCMQGMRAGTDATSVGRAATSAVVLGITLIIAANAVIDWMAALLDI